MPIEVDPTEEPAPESIGVWVMRDGNWVYVGQAEYLEDRSMLVTIDDEGEVSEITRNLNSGYINSYSILGENLNG